MNFTKCLSNPQEGKNKTKQNTEKQKNRKGEKDRHKP